jgi:hypothetical protein
VRLDLFARSSDRLYRIQTQDRRVTATPTPSLDDSGPVTFIVGPRQVLVRNWNYPAVGCVVPDGQPAQDLPRPLTSAEQILAGPSGRLWVTTS